MSYSLNLYFKPAVRRDRLFQHFALRRYFRAANDKLKYENPDTGVYFWIKLSGGGRNLLLQRTVRSAEFEVNYNRPNFFGVEAERELSALMSAFRPRIEDPQIDGMGEGPYSSEGFFRGWKFGNAFSVRDRMSRTPAEKIPSLPTEVLREVWRWNDRCAERRLRQPGFKVPEIVFLRLDGRLCRVVVWPIAKPILLPRVEYVLPGWFVDGEQRFGMVSWSEVLEIAKRARFDTAKDPLALTYLVTPPEITDWAAALPLVDVEALKREYLAMDQIIDDELISAARELEARVVSDSESI